MAQKKASASLSNLYRIFTLPEGDDSTLEKIERQISKNLMGFLSEHVVSGEAMPAELEDSFRETKIPDQPIFVSEQADFLLKKVVAQSVHTSSPSFVGHMTSAIPYFMLSLSKLMVALNQNLVKIETSKAFTPLERQVVGMLHRLVYEQDTPYYEEFTHHRSRTLGVFCSGGTIANLTALWVARNRCFGADGMALIRDQGIGTALQKHGYKGLRVFVSARGHYSLRKSVDVLGIGRSNLISIPTNDNYQIDIDQLDVAIKQSKQDGFGIMAIVGVAGTTETGAVDDLRGLAKVAQREQCHYHVDAAWGGPTLFSNRYGSLLDGIADADSVALDAHKQLYVPMGVGAVLFKDPEASEAIIEQAQYVIRKGSRDIGKHTLEGSRPGMALLVHSGLRVIGRKGYELLIDQGIEKALEFAKAIKDQPDFQLVSQPQLNLVTYRYCPDWVQESLAGKEYPESLQKVLDELVIKIQRQQRGAGKTFVSRTRFRAPWINPNVDSTVFRTVLANPLTTPDILHSILEEQHRYGESLLKEGYNEKLRQAVT